MYDTILVPVDGSAPSNAAVDEAVELAGAFGATVHFLFVVDVEGFALDEHAGSLVEQLHRQGEHAVEEARETAERQDVTAFGEVREGVPHRTIVRYAEEIDADVVVMGTHGRKGFRHFLLGSVTERVVREAPVPVLTVRAPEEERGESGTEREESEES
ncbi:universal stress protein [Halospeciosus flavus]|uniref:Universal stress protein n=1 Tax=Halospeciosus flavus TaxID=3032283 RepID=A0ABD5Z501_9EURY|nr:universal stress protein [Halospeciosus flavus]